MEKTELLSKLEMNSIIGGYTSQQTSYQTTTQNLLTYFFGDFDYESNGDAYADDCCNQQ